MLSFISTVTLPVPRPTVGVAHPQCGSFLKRSFSQLKRMALGTSATPSVQGKKGFVFLAAKESSQDASTCPPQVHIACHGILLLVVHSQPALHSPVFQCCPFL